MSLQGIFETLRLVIDGIQRPASGAAGRVQVFTAFSIIIVHLLLHAL